MPISEVLKNKIVVLHLRSGSYYFFADESEVLEAVKDGVLNPNDVVINMTKRNTRSIVKKESLEIE